MAKNKDVKWSEVTNKYIGRPYKLGGWDEGGMDCFSLFVSVLRDVGYKLPKSMKFGNITFDNYQELWGIDEEKALQLIYEWITTIMIKTDLKSMRNGNVLILSKANNMMVGIACGSGRFITVSENKGVVAPKIDNFKLLEIYK